METIESSCITHYQYRTG